MEADSIIPDEFTCKEQILHLKLQMKLKDKHGKLFGHITEKRLEIGHKLQFTDVHDKIIAVAHKKLISIDTNLEVKDAHHHKIGCLDHMVIKSAMSVIKDRFQIRDSHGKRLGQTQQMDILRESITIKDPHGVEIGEMKHDLINILGDKWHCKIDGGKIDKRLLIFLPAFVSVMQEEKKQDKKSD